jgi:uncharacterized phage-associated protein
MEYVIIAVLLIVLFLVTLRKEEITKTKVVYISKQDNNNTMSYSPTTIANYFIQEKAKFGKLTSMKLIKLVYISYAWYITLKGKENPLTNEKAQAWKYGPVFPSLYKVIKSEGTVEVEKPLPNNREEVITREDANFLDKMWDLYGKYNGVELSAMTHAEKTPWREVYCRNCNSEIPDDLIISHYTPKLKSAS